MSDEIFEISFSGQIAEGADLETVKNNIAKIFKADENRLAQMFSGRRVTIKKQADEATVAKYRAAFEKAGAVCDVRSLADAATVSSPQPQSQPEQPAAEAPAAVSSESDYVSRYPESEQTPQALLTDPLGISGDSIPELAADVAPVGSQMQDQIVDVPAPSFDINGMDVAPVGSDLSTQQEDEPPPPPDTSGLSMAD